MKQTKMLGNRSPGAFTVNCQAMQVVMVLPCENKVITPMMNGLLDDRAHSKFERGFFTLGDEGPMASRMGPFDSWPMGSY